MARLDLSVLLCGVSRRLAGYDSAGFMRLPHTCRVPREFIIRAQTRIVLIVFTVHPDLLHIYFGNLHKTTLQIIAV